MCCDSAHKTLPVLTGGAYLHLSKKRLSFLDSDVKEAFRLFGSTSPSYLILQSLDLANVYLEQLTNKLTDFIPIIDTMKQKLVENGYQLIGNEPLKLTIATKDYGYSGNEFAKLLAKQNIIVEFSDPDYVVFMFTPSLKEADIQYLTDYLLKIPRKQAINISLPQFSYPTASMSIREAMLSPFETLPIDKCIGKVLAKASVGCPPAVPILVCGEVIDEKAVECFKYYGILSCHVIK